MFAKQVRLAVIVLLAMVNNFANAQVKSLCEKGENSVWSCQHGKKIYSICSSSVLTETIGYLQYRAGTLERSEFRYPVALRHPKGLFEYDMLGNGTIRLTFKNGRYGYEIVEPAIGSSLIYISKDDKHLSTLQCEESTESLSENSTMKLFKTVGIYQ